MIDVFAISGLPWGPTYHVLVGGRKAKKEDAIHLVPTTVTIVVGTRCIASTAQFIAREVCCMFSIGREHRQ